MLGTLAFFAGIIICIIGGWARDNGGMALALIILGIIVGLLNVTTKEMLPFLVATIALIVLGVGATANAGPFNALFNVDALAGFGRVLNSFVGYVAVFMIPAAFINAVRMVWALARPGD